MPDEFSEAIKHLRERESHFVAEVEEANARLKEAEAGLKKAQQALRALGQKPSTKGSKARRNPDALRNQIISTATGVIKQQGPTRKGKLKAEVEARLAEAGVSTVGFALRFKEALKDPRFIDSPGGIRLAEVASGPQAKRRTRRKSPTAPR